MAEQKHTNHLVHETSPYLLQHAHNPVDWYPWSEEALRRARDEDKPILLSIGYSACHWCHVMERESFEHETIASLMNEHFINIKVDREERPDLDAIYMAAVQMMTGGGGWPMTVFLTPDQIPFYGGTYFPPEDRRGMPGFPRVLMSVARTYRERREQIRADASAIVNALRSSGELEANEGGLTPSILDGAADRLMGAYDDRDGGFGAAPKFPPSMQLTFLLRSHLRTGDGALLAAVEQTLDKMACGGICDQLGGGFHRYSVDSRWLVPHFEKMLYDNALLSRVYLDAYLLTKKPLYRRIVEETLGYVLREMTSAEGGFYSSQDADSEGQEGKYFVWRPAEVAAVLGQEDAALFCRYFDITPEGNFEGSSILNIPRPAALVARLNGVSEQQLLEIVRRGKELLLRERGCRVRPGRDEKILTAWNGLMLRSLAEAARGLDRGDYRLAAIGAAEFLLKRARREGRLLRSYKDGEARLNAYLEDYAFVVDGLISLYEATFDPRWLDEAIALAKVLLELFTDESGTGFYFTSNEHELLIHRPRESYDGAIPSGSSVAAGALLRLWRLTTEERWSVPARALLESMAASMARHPQAFSNFLCALDFCLAPVREIAVIGNPQDSATQVLLAEVSGRYLPNSVLACGLARRHPLLRGKPRIEGKPTAYVCIDNVCGPPVTDPSALGQLLDEPMRHQPGIQ
jgi:uncharacterized protein YyaL (SSP411 family)